MQKQYKLYKMDMDATDMVLSKLKKYRYLKIGNRCVAIEYDYMNNSYKKLLDDMSELDISQYIITANVCYNMIRKFSEKNIVINEIRLNSLFEDDNSDIIKYIKRINTNKEKEKNLQLLLDLLQWYNYDEGIDVEELSFTISKMQRKIQFHIYNNGVLAIDNEMIVEEVTTLFSDIL